MIYQDQKSLHVSYFLRSTPKKEKNMEKYRKVMLIKIQRLRLIIVIGGKNKHNTFFARFPYVNFLIREIFGLNFLVEKSNMIFDFETVEICPNFDFLRRDLSSNFTFISIITSHKK